MLRLESNVLSISSIKNYLSVFPNPVNKSFNIKADFKVEAVRLYALSGKIHELSFEENQQDLVIDFEKTELKGGMYFIEVMGSFNESFTQKIILKE